MTSLRKGGGWKRMKQSPQMQRIQENMRPGAIALEGFLGRDTRNLADILEEDNSAVRRLDLSHGVIAQRMEELKNAGAEGLGEFIEAATGFTKGRGRCTVSNRKIWPRYSKSYRSRGIPY